MNVPIEREITREPDVPELNQGAINLLTDLCFRQDDELKPADCIFVFGVVRQAEKCCGVVRGLLNQNISNRVILTGGMPKYSDSYDGYIKSEAQMLEELINPAEFPSVLFYRDDFSTNTLENVTEALKVYDFSQHQDIIFVCKSIHAIRGYLTLRRFLPHQNLIQHSFEEIDKTQGDIITRNNWFNSLAGKQKVYSQYLRLSFYGRRGDISFAEIQERVEKLEAMGYKLKM
jgi:hypothetical protein